MKRAVCEISMLTATPLETPVCQTDDSYALSGGTCQRSVWDYYPTKKKVFFGVMSNEE